MSTKTNYPFKPGQAVKCVLGLLTDTPLNATVEKCDGVTCELRFTSSHKGLGVTFMTLNEFSDVSVKGDTITF